MANKMKHIGVRGCGYFCDVYEYQNEETGERLAVKKLKRAHYTNDNYRYRLIREIHLLKVLDSCPEIISLIKDGNDRDKENLWYSMPCADYNLYKYIKKNAQKLPVDIRFKFADQIISAIKFAHSNGILHRDISPNNILVFETREDLNVKVSDFGLGKDKESLSHYTNSSVDGYGQILYVAPEQRDKLNEATIKSDIYSLGKLIYFLFTAKDPDNLKQFILSPLVIRATEEEPSKRYENIEDFENHYIALKKLQFDQEIPVEYLSLKDFIEVRQEIDWNLFHQIAINGSVANHAYHDFLSPVISIFSDRAKIFQYYSTIGRDFKAFVQRFSDMVYECLGTVGWPFNATDSFGSFLKEVVLKVPDSEIRLISLKLMWYLAYVSDQWSVQSDLKTLLNKEFITDDIEISLADFIQSEPIEIHISDFTGLNIPPIVKKGIIQANEAHKKQVVSKNVNLGEWDF